MKVLGNIIWLIFGGLECALGYFSASVALMVTIVGIPFGIETLKLGLLSLWPFGAKITPTGKPQGCIRIPLNIIWFIFGGFFTWIMHIFFGVLLGITIVGIPWGKQHFKLAGLALHPFGHKVDINF
jgi:uncharacterized membrane protein YccF (DUF307 family)